jgi:hypothetical protein
MREIISFRLAFGITLTFIIMDRLPPDFIFRLMPYALQLKVPPRDGVPRTRLYR